MIKFRTMTNKRDSTGALLPDSMRLTPFGWFIRAIFIDELSGFINILFGHSMYLLGNIKISHAT